MVLSLSFMFQYLVTCTERLTCYLSARMVSDFVLYQIRLFKAATPPGPVWLKCLN